VRDNGPASSVRPIFVGGTGRSGTTVLGHLLGHHGEVFRVIPTEVRFLTGRNGLIDLLAASQAAANRGLVERIVHRRRRTKGELTPAKFSNRLRHWYRWTGSDGVVRGLHLGGLELTTVDGALDGFDERMRSDPLGAARRLAEEILAAMTGASARWVETTPANASRAHGLRQLFPSMRLIHVVRDGRDVAASIVTKVWGPNEIFGALELWAERMNQAYAALETFPKDQALTIRLEDLVIHDRDATLERIGQAADLRPDEGMRAFHEQDMVAGRLHPGRWREQLTGDDTARFDERYRVHLRALRSRFGTVPPTDDLDRPA
jgi:sulfotransferase family protein